MNQRPSTLAVIPARYASTRLHGKPLALIHDKPMIQWVYEAVSKTKTVRQILVATDDEKVCEVVKAFGGEAMLTPTTIQSGTDRMAFVAEKISADIYINVQGDEPLMSSQAIDAAVELVASKKFQLSTVMTPFLSDHPNAELLNPNVVKVLADHNQRAVYFSRFPIPYSKISAQDAKLPFACRRHVGLYVYERATLFQFRKLPVSDWERAESLEQLRALENGIPIGIVEIPFVSLGVDTPEDLEMVKNYLSKEKSK